MKSYLFNGLAILMAFLMTTTAHSKPIIFGGGLRPYLNPLEVKPPIVNPTLENRDPSTPLKVRMRILFLTATNDPVAEPELPLAIQSFQSLSIQYDQVTMTKNGLVEPGNFPTLESSDGSALYYGVVLSSSQLTFVDDQGKWQSALSAEQWQKLEAYELKYKIRRVSLNSWPNSSLGVQIDGTPNSEPTFVQLSGSSESYTSGLTPDLAAPLTNTWQMPAAVIDPLRAKPVLEFSGLCTNEKSESVPCKESHKIASVISTFPDGREQLHFFFVQSRFSVGSFVAANIWLRWLTRDFYLGKRRALLNVQVDDFFMDTPTWNPKTAANTDDIARAFRCTPADMQNFLEYSKNHLYPILGTDDFHIELAFNGIGVWENGGYQKDPLFKFAKKSLTDFNWINHTYSHMDLDLFNYTRTMSDLHKNGEFAKDLFGTLEFQNYSRHGIITPRISGLFSDDVLRAFLDNQIQFAVGDTTRPNLTPANMYVGRWTTRQLNGREGILIIPRGATEVYYDVSTPKELMSQYNKRYHNYFNRDLSSSEIFQREGVRVAQNLLRFEPIPYMFHQTNLRSFFLNGTTANESSVPRRHSLISLWLDAVVKEYRRYSQLPIKSLKFEELGAQFQRRMSFDQCGFTGFLHLQGGKFVGFEGGSEKTCDIELTSPTPIVSATLPPAVNTNTEGTLNVPVRAESYGPDRNYFFHIEQGQQPYFRFNGEFL